MKVTLNINIGLKYAKVLYREHFDYDKKHPVSKNDLTAFFTMLLEGDLESITPNKNDNED